MDIIGGIAAPPLKKRARSRALDAGRQRGEARGPTPANAFGWGASPTCRGRGAARHPPGGAKLRRRDPPLQTAERREPLTTEASSRRRAAAGAGSTSEREIDGNQKSIGTKKQ